MSTRIWVNGEEMTLAWNVGALDYNRVLRLAGMEDRAHRYDFEIIYADPKSPDIQHMGPGDFIFPLPDMQIQVRPILTEKKPWWRYLWPA